MTTMTVPSRSIGLRPHRVVRAEWRRQVSLGSTWWTLTILVLAIAGSGAFTGLGVALGHLAATPEDVGALGGALSGAGAAEIVVAVFGLLAVTGEYATGATRSMFTAVPARIPVLLARAAVVGATVLVLSVALTTGTFGIARILIGSAGLDLSITAPGVLRALAGAAVYLALLAVMGTGVGWLLRSTAGGLGVMFGLLYGLPVIGLMIPDRYAATVTRFLPANLGGAMMEPSAAPGMLSAWTATAVLVAWAAAILILAAAVVRRRDA
jgi:ABC-2 type transport system permease protein